MKIKKILFTFFLMGGAMFLAKPLSVGDKAPDFTLVDQDNNQRSLSDFVGRYVVLYFYPMNDTPGCTKQACSFRDAFGEFEKNDIIVIGINYSSSKSHKKFAEKYNLPFILLSDKDKSVAKKYGTKNWFFLPFPKRTTFIIDPEGIISAIMKNFDLTSHPEQIINVVNVQKQHTSK